MKKFTCSVGCKQNVVNMIMVMYRPSSCKNSPQTYFKGLWIFLQTALHQLIHEIHYYKLHLPFFLTPHFKYLFWKSKQWEVVSVQLSIFGMWVCGLGVKRVDVGVFWLGVQVLRVRYALGETFLVFRLSKDLYLVITKSS